MHEPWKYILSVTRSRPNFNNYLRDYFPMDSQKNRQKEGAGGSLFAYFVSLYQTVCIETQTVFAVYLSHL